VVVLADEAIAGIPSGVGVDTERGDPEVIADRRPLRIGVSDVGGWDVGQRGVRSGHGGDSSGHNTPVMPDCRGLARARSSIDAMKVLAAPSPTPAPAGRLREWSGGVPGHAEFVTGTAQR
jgi:hypothetical protein